MQEGGERSLHVLLSYIEARRVLDHILQLNYLHKEGIEHAGLHEDQESRPPFEDVVEAASEEFRSVQVCSAEDRVKAN